MRSRTLRKSPRRSWSAVSRENQTSTRFSQEALVGTKVQMEPRMPAEPPLNRRMFVRRVVVEDGVDSHVRRRLCVEQVQELAKFLMLMARQTRADDGALEDIQRGKQRRRPVPLVVVGHGAGSAGRPPALAMPANKKKDPRYAEIYRDMPGYSGMRPPASPPNDRRCATACWCGLRGDRPTKLWIKTFDPSNGLQTSVSGGFGVVEIGGISGACPRWVTDPAAEPAPPDHKRGVMKRPLRALRRAGSRCRRYGR